jgi:hypothetical protein
MPEQAYKLSPIRLVVTAVSVYKVSEVYIKIRRAFNGGYQIVFGITLCVKTTEELLNGEYF